MDDGIGGPDRQRLLPGDLAERVVGNPLQRAGRRESAPALTDGVEVGAPGIGVQRVRVAQAQEVRGAPALDEPPGS